VEEAKKVQKQHFLSRMQFCSERLSGDGKLKRILDTLDPHVRAFVREAKRWFQQRKREIGGFKQQGLNGISITLLALFFLKHGSGYRSDPIMRNALLAPGSKMRKAAHKLRKEAGIDMASRG
ncbi:unnamed protein product, partial [Amoebophrya sp. A120]